MFGSPLPAGGTRRVALLVGIGVGLGLTVAAWWWFPVRSAPVVRGAPLPQQAYLWQKQWTPEVRAAAGEVGAGQTPLASLCVAYAEISGGGGGPASKFTVQKTTGLDWALLARSGTPVGFAVRVHAFPGEVSTTREPFFTLCNTLAELCVEADEAGVKPAEIQVDFDCPTSRLRGFASWLRALQKTLPWQTFRFTALPAWLRSRDFAPLARTTGGYVLQLHWLEKPGPDGRPLATICDPRLAKEAVERAARLGVPFRAALPTYGYRLVLDAHGKLLAAAGESAALEAARPPPGGSVRTLEADPLALADLIRDWQTSRPEALRGVIWYRLPVAGDRLNWVPRTLRAVAAGHRPQPRLALRWTHATDDAPYELRLSNDGDAEAPCPAAITVRCASPPSAADGVGGFELPPNGALVQELVFTRRNVGGGQTRTVSAGGSLAFGWVRLATSAITDPKMTASWTFAAPAVNP